MEFQVHTTTAKAVARALDWRNSSLLLSSFDRRHLTLTSPRYFGMMRAFQQGTPARHAESHPNQPRRNMR